MLPSLFFQDTKGFVEAGPSLPLNAATWLWKQRGESCPYKAEDFEVKLFKAKPDDWVLSFTWPQGLSPLSRWSFFFFTKDYQPLGCYTMEYDDDPGSSSIWCCGWNAEGRHLNYGMIKKTTEGDALSHCLFLLRKSQKG